MGQYDDTLDKEIDEIRKKLMAKSGGCDIGNYNKEDEPKDVPDISECDVSDLNVCDKCEKKYECPHHAQVEQKILSELRKKDREWAEGTFFWWEYGW